MINIDSSCACGGIMRVVDEKSERCECCHQYKVMAARCHRCGKDVEYVYVYGVGDHPEPTQSEALK